MRPASANKVLHRSRILNRPFRNLQHALDLGSQRGAKQRAHLVVRDKEGKPYSVRYDQVNAMLLNEFLKEHRKNDEQQATIAQLRSGMEALTATVKEQAAQIQKVSVQLEASKPSPQTVLNNQ